MDILHLMITIRFKIYVKVVVESLKHHGIQYIFGIVGIPIIEVAVAAQQVIF